MTTKGYVDARLGSGSDTQKHTVNLHLYRGMTDTLMNVSVADGDHCTIIPSLPGWTFKGWVTSNGSPVGSTGIKSNLDLYGTWEKHVYIENTSPDLMYMGGYERLINTTTSNVVVEGSLHHFVVHENTNRRADIVLDEGNGTATFSPNDMNCYKVNVKMSRQYGLGIHKIKTPFPVGVSNGRVQVSSTLTHDVSMLEDSTYKTGTEIGQNKYVHGIRVRLLRGHNLAEDEPIMHINAYTSGGPRTYTPIERSSGDYSGLDEWLNDTYTTKRDKFDDISVVPIADNSYINVKTEWVVTRVGDSSPSFTFNPSSKVSTATESSNDVALSVTDLGVDNFYLVTYRVLALNKKYHFNETTQVWDDKTPSDNYCGRIMGIKSDIKFSIV